jgi:hypothetical protein
MATVEDGCKLGALRHWRNQVLVQDLRVNLTAILEIDRAYGIVDALSVYGGYISIERPS